MLSRVAESLFWMRRYAERVDGILRLLRINAITSLDRSAEFSWQPVLERFGGLDPEKAAVLSRNSDEVLRYMICKRGNPNSVRNLVALARENARGMQDHVTKEVWECFNEFYHKVNSPEVENALERDEQIVLLGDLLNHCLLFFGVSDVTMPRGQGWDYMNLGKLIERSAHTIDLLDLRFGNINYDLNNPADIPLWRNFLLSLSGYELYLKQYRGGIQSQNVVDLAVLNPEFPRSIHYCLVRMERTIREMAYENTDATPSLQKIAGRLRSKVEYADMESISKTGLHNFLIEVRNELYTFNNALSKTYFAYT
jgi:uncharacterized alpha-E superfamily protein